MAVDLGHVAGPFLDLEENSSGSAIVGDQVTASVMAYVPSGGYAHIMEGGVNLVGYHTWDGQLSASSLAAVGRTCTTESYTLRSLYGERK
jgi:hypothetical protein